MHSMTIKVRDQNKTSMYRVHYNGNFSGAVKVTGPAEEIDSTLHHQTHESEVTIPFEVMQTVVLEKYRADAIRKFEEMTGEELEAASKAWFL